MTARFKQPAKELEKGSQKGLKRIEGSASFLTRIETMKMSLKGLDGATEARIL